MGGSVNFIDAATGSGGGGGDSSSSGCPPEAQMVYVTGQPAELWSFWPPTFTFTKIGDVTCTSPTHMTVDRTGTAWIVGGGNVYKTSTKTAACSLAPQWQPQTGFGDFAVSFVGVTNNDTSLYLLGASSGQLGKFDIVLGTFQVVGTPSVGSPGGDMTSRDDGKLWFLQAYTTPHPLFQIDPATATVLQALSVNASGTGNQALAYFGARFYAFENGMVNEYDPVANTVTMLGYAPLGVTGAGQSTCVPADTVDAGTPPPIQ
jgi:hypothetical protein